MYMLTINCQDFKSLRRIVDMIDDNEAEVTIKSDPMVSTHPGISAVANAKPSAREQEEVTNFQGLQDHAGSVGDRIRTDYVKPIKKTERDGLDETVEEVVPSTLTLPTFTDVKNTILELAKQEGRNASLDVLKKFNVEKVTALQVNQYAAVIAEARKVLSRT